MAALSISTIAGQTSREMSLRPSPKRKRQTSLHASDSLFAPDLLPSSSQTTVPSSSPSPPPSPNLLPSHPAPSSSRGDTPTSTPLLQIPLLDNEVRDPYAGADSPRSAVARKLEGLDLRLHQRGIPILSFGDSHLLGEATKKKPKLSSPSPPSSPPHDTQMATDPSSNPPKPHHLLSPTSPPNKRAKSPTGPSEENLTWWSDAEITGHLGLDPEDDGYGINGIGFKPTAQMAAARASKRRRQVEEWRSREMREERRRRAEGRRGRNGSADPGGGGVVGGGVGKRSVRFAGS